MFLKDNNFQVIVGWLSRMFLLWLVLLCLQTEQGRAYSQLYRGEVVLALARELAQDRAGQQRASTREQEGLPRDVQLQQDISVTSAEMVQKVRHDPRRNRRELGRPFGQFLLRA